MNGDTTQNSLVHTKREFQPFWQVDLREVYIIRKIVIYNRNDGASDQRLQGYQLDIFKNGKSVYKHIDPTPSGTSPGDEVTIDIPGGGVSGRIVKIFIPGRTEIINFREVEVYGLTLTQAPSSMPSPVPTSRSLVSWALMLDLSFLFGRTIYFLLIITSFLLIFIIYYLNLTIFFDSSPSFLN